MDFGKIKEKLLRTPGVVLVFETDDETFGKVAEMESGIQDTTFGMPLDNRALAKSMGQECRMVLFCDMRFQPPADHVMVMYNAAGEMVAFDVPHGRISEFENDPDLVWLCEDFVMRPDALSEAKAMTMLPQRIDCIGEAEGVRDPVVFYPALTTDTYLREKYGVDPMNADIASAILSFDLT